MKDLVQKRSEAAKSLRDMLAVAKSEERSLTVDERSTYDNIVEEINSIDETAKREKLLADFDQLEKREIVPEKGEQREKADPSLEEFRSFLSNGIIPAGRMSEKRDMTSGTGSSGGYLIPETYAKLLREAATANSCVRRLATVSSWKGDGAFPVVTGFGTTYLMGENSGTDVTDTSATFDQKKVSGYQLMYMVNVPKKLLVTNDYGLEGKIPTWWGKSLGAKEESYFIKGTGDSQPYGLVASATVGTDTAANSAITGDDIINWYYSLPVAYRNAATWIFADSTVKLIRQIKNTVTTSGALQYLWMPGLGSEPDTLMGRPIAVSDECSAFAAGADVGVFGDISQYQVVDFGTPEMIRDPYTKAGQGQVRFIGWELVDAALPLAEAVVTCPIRA